MTSIDVRIIREAEVCERLGISHSTFWRLRKRGRFPEPMYISDLNIKGWLSKEIDNWIEENMQSGGIE